MITIKNVLYLFAFKILMTIILLFSFYSINSTKELNLLNQNYTSSAFSDKKHNGKSTSWVSKNNKYSVNCELKEGFPTPFCGLAINIKKDFTKGIDLSGYKHLEINLVFDNPENSNNAPRVYLRNYNEKYSSENPDSMMKFNGVQLNGYISGDTVKIDLDKFQVASWWIERYSIPVKYAGAEMNNVSILQFENGMNAELGDYFIIVKEAKLTGYYVEEVLFIYFLVFLWFLSSLIFVVNIYFKERERSIKLNNLNEKIIEKSNKDELTGLYNRHAIKSLINDEESIFNKSEVVSCVYIDIDYFKNVNDTYGHAMGDKVLKDLSKLVSKNIRKTDYFSRWGGEEFALFCLDSTKEDTEKLVRCLRCKINNYKFSHGQKMTCSFGIAEIHKGEAFMSAFDRADKALYEAKNTGRDKIIIR